MPGMTLVLVTFFLYTAPPHRVEQINFAPADDMAECQAGANWMDSDENQAELLAIGETEFSLCLPMATEVAMKLPPMYYPYSGLASAP